MTKRISWRRTAGLATLAATSAMLCLPLPARALTAPSPAVPGRPGYYTQAVCSDEGEPSGAEYWLSEPEFGGGYPVGLGHLNTCASSGAMTLRDEAKYDAEPGSGPSYVYEAPPGILIAGGVAKLSMTSPGGKVALEAPRQSPNPTLTLASCDSSCTGVHNATVSIPDTEWWLLWAKAMCEPASGQSTCTAGGVNAEMSIDSAMILLHTEATPEAIGLTGSLTESPVSGTASASFTAKESKGPGIYRVSVQIDGSTVWAQTPETSFGQCVAHGTYENALVFRNAVPCKEEVPVRVEIPTGTVPDGPHLVEVAVEDAAGDRSVVFDKMLTFANHPGSGTPPLTVPIATTTSSTAPPERGSCNGTPCDEAAKLTAAAGEPMTITRALGHTPVTLKGRLTSPTGAPIKDAQVKVVQQIVGSAAVTQIASTTTGADGSWSLNVPAGASRLMQVAFYSHTLDTIPASILAFHENVQGAVSMRVPHRARIGRAVVFTGQLAGGYVPAGGESVQMEIFYGGRWRTIEVLPTNSAGRWSYKYVFTLGVGASYRFRAVTVPNGAYPFVSSHSKPVRVMVQR
jgi:hypothetical protein